MFMYVRSLIQAYRCTDSYAYIYRALHTCILMLICNILADCAPSYLRRAFQRHSNFAQDLALQQATSNTPTWNGRINHPLWPTYCIYNLIIFQLQTVILSEINNPHFMSKTLIKIVLVTVVCVGQPRDGIIWSDPMIRPCTSALCSLLWLPIFRWAWLK